MMTVAAAAAFRDSMAGAMGMYTDPAQAAAIPAIAAVAGLALLAVSFLLSRHFYGSKDV